jgi:GxxExxY protein
MGMIKEEYKYSATTEKIIGCAMKVHSWFGPGFPEIIYQRSLLIELEKAGLKCKAEVEEDVYYQDAFVGKRKLDIIVEERILLELKATAELDNSCYNKMMNYLRVFKVEVGLLLNFGTPSLQFRRFIL